jgi:hypothetical protein
MYHYANRVKPGTQTHVPRLVRGIAKALKSVSTIAWLVIVEMVLLILYTHCLTR